VYEEYVVDGDSVENWKELITIQYFPGLQKKTNLDIYEAMTRRNLALICPSIKWEPLSQSSDERIWKWSIEGCQGQPDQSEIARAKRTDEGIHVWHYAIKESPMSSDKGNIWLEKLKTIVISKS
jgi:hypothetical protein